MARNICFAMGTASWSRFETVKLTTTKHQEENLRLYSIEKNLPIFQHELPKLQNWEEKQDITKLVVSTPAHATVLDPGGSSAGFLLRAVP